MATDLSATQHHGYGTIGTEEIERIGLDPEAYHAAQRREQGILDGHVGTHALRAPERSKQGLLSIDLLRHGTSELIASRTAIDHMFGEVKAQEGTYRVGHHKVANRHNIPLTSQYLEALLLLTTTRHHHHGHGRNK
jgi:hypothetical protein